MAMARQLAGQTAIALLAAFLALAGCDRMQPARPAADASTLAPLSVQPERSPSHGPLKLELPILAVMLGTMNEASFVIFQAGTSDQAPSDDTWRHVSTAAITLVGDATLITIPGTGPSDQQWVASR